MSLPLRLLLPAMKVVRDRQIINQKLRLGEHKGHRYFCIWVPYDQELGEFMQSPSRAYFEFKAEEEKKAVEYESSSMGSVTHLWYPGKQDSRCVTEGYVEGLKFTGEMGFDSTWDTIEEIEKYIKECIDGYVSFEPEKKRKREEECKECAKEERTKCTGCEKGLCYMCVVHECYGCKTIYHEEECECELSPYSHDDYDCYHRDCYLATKKQKVVSE